jgi:hypothetical protein
MYVSVDEVRQAVTVPNTMVTDLMIRSFISYAERETDLFTFTTYWSTEYTGTATSATASTLVNTSAKWTTNDFSSNHFVKITGGTGSGQIRGILPGNSPTSLSVDRNWTVTPDNTSTYAIYYSQTNSLFSDAIDGSGRSYMFMPAYPIRSVDSLSIASTSVTSSNVLIYADQGKLTLGDSAEYKIFASYKPQLVSIAYWWGVNGVPQEIKRFVTLKAAVQALMQLKSTAYNTPLSYNMPEGSVSIASPTQAIQSVIDTYNQQIEDLSKLLVRYPYLG